jgi:hypothetical protein
MHEVSESDTAKRARLVVVFMMSPVIERSVCRAICRKHGAVTCRKQGLSTTRADLSERRNKNTRTTGAGIFSFKY